MNSMDVYERLRASEQSRRLAWQVLQEIRQVLEILGDQRIPYEGEMKRFRAEGDSLLRALTDLISQCRNQIHQLGQDFAELEKLAGERDLPRDVLQTIRHMTRRRRVLGLSETQLRERLSRLQEPDILPAHGTQPDPDVATELHQQLLLVFAAIARLDSVLWTMTKSRNYALTWTNLHYLAPLLIRPENDLLVGTRHS